MISFFVQSQISLMDDVPPAWQRNARANPRQMQVFITHFTVHQAMQIYFSLLTTDDSTWQQNIDSLANMTTTIVKIEKNE